MTSVPALGTCHGKGTGSVLCECVRNQVLGISVAIWASYYEWKRLVILLPTFRHSVIQEMQTEVVGSRSWDGGRRKRNDISSGTGPGKHYAGPPVSSCLSMGEVTDVVMAVVADLQLQGYTFELQPTRFLWKFSGQDPAPAHQATQTQQMDQALWFIWDHCSQAWVNPWGYWIYRE